MSSASIASYSLETALPNQPAMLKQYGGKAVSPSLLCSHCLPTCSPLYFLWSLCLSLRTLPFLSPSFPSSSPLPLPLPLVYRRDWRVRNPLSLQALHHKRSPNLQSSRTTSSLWGMPHLGFVPPVRAHPPGPTAPSCLPDLRRHRVVTLHHDKAWRSWYLPRSPHDH